MLCLGLVILFAGANLALPSSNLALPSSNLALPSSKVKQFDLEKAADYFEQFIIDFERKYKDEDEKNMRFDNFKDHLLIVNLRNMGSDEAVHGITKFADYTEEEKNHMKSCFFAEDMFREQNPCPDAQLSSDVNVTDVPAAFDWRDKGIVSPVKDQGQCGSCWAFSAIANAESAYAQKHGKILDLSEQELVDCDTNSLGCGGARNLDAGLSALVLLGGAESEADYPYTARTGKCSFDKSKVKAQLASCHRHDANRNPDLVKKALVESGPLTIGVDATDMLSYKDGILDCSFEIPNHAVLLVGYGSEGGKDFWIIKNSWDVTYGEEGYVRVSQKEDCGLTLFPLVSSVAV